MRKPKRFFPIRQVGLQIDTTRWEKLRVAQAQGVIRLTPSAPPVTGGALAQIANSFVTNLFQPLLLFFFMGFAIPLLRIPFEYPKALYESLTIYLLIAIGWHGGELMAELPSSQLAIAGGLVVVGMATNGFIGLAATAILGWITPMRKIDAVTVGAYYGFRLSGDFRDLPGDSRIHGYPSRQLHAGYVGRYGDSRLPSRPAPRSPFAASKNGSVG